MHFQLFSSNGAKLFSNKFFLRLQKRDTLTALERLLISVFIIGKILHNVFFFAAFICVAAELRSSTSPVRDSTVALEVTLHIPSSPGDLGSVLHYRPHWNLIHPSARCTNNRLCTQGFFLINRHAKLIYCLFVQSEKASRLSFLSGEFSARQS